MNDWEILHWQCVWNRKISDALALYYYGMTGNWGAPGTSGKSLSFADWGLAGSYAFQVLDLSGYSEATLSFDLTTIAHGAPGSAYFAASVGYDGEVVRYWLGCQADGEAMITHVSVPVANPTAFASNVLVDPDGADEQGSTSGI